MWVILTCSKIRNNRYRLPCWRLFMPPPLSLSLFCGRGEPARYVRSVALVDLKANKPPCGLLGANFTRAAAPDWFSYCFLLGFPSTITASKSKARWQPNKGKNDVSQKKSRTRNSELAPFPQKPTQHSYNPEGFF